MKTEATTITIPKATNNHWVNLDPAFSNAKYCRLFLSLGTLSRLELVNKLVDLLLSYAWC